ncbi:MAG: hypothetical protein NT062_29830, partial [Proteobacteria bacterium]|nr:hypothetical protein [Pseudomonadota bacterium]
MHRLLPSLIALLAGTSCATTTPIVAPTASPVPRVTTPAPARPEARGDAPFVPKKLLAIDWDHVAASNEAEALALWRVI